MLRMAGNGWILPEMTGNCWKWLKWLKITENDWKCWKWLEMAWMEWNSWKSLENGWDWLGIAVIYIVHVYFFAMKHYKQINKCLQSILQIYGYHENMTTARSCQHTASATIILVIHIKSPHCVKAVSYCPAVLAGISLVFSWKGAGVTINVLSETRRSRSLYHDTIPDHGRKVGIVRMAEDE